MSGVSISLAKTPEDLDALFRFRYSVYVEEMNRPQKYADHAARRISDPLDDRGLNLLAKLPDGSVVGCLRSNLARYGGLDYYEDILGMRNVGADHPELTSVSTRLMVAAEYRKSTLANRLFLQNFQLGLDNGVRWNFIDCNDHLVSFFERFGFVRTGGATHEEYGDVNIMRIDIRDIKRLREIGSPFARLFDDSALTAEAAL